MNPEPSDDNPFTPPATALMPPLPPTPPPVPEPAGPEGEKGSRPHVAMTVVLWVLWGLLFFSYPADLLLVSLQRKPETEPSWALVRAFAVVGFLQLSLALFFRWLCFRFCISAKRLPPESGRAAGLGIIGGLVIFSQIRSVETYGLILFFQNYSWPCYLGFAVPSFLLFLFVMPALLLRFKK